MPENLFANQTISLDSPYTHHANITPSDETELAFVTRSLYIGNGGTLRCVTVGGEEAVYSGLPSGMMLAGFFTKIMATDTTASGLVGVW